MRSKFSGNVSLNYLICFARQFIYENRAKIWENYLHGWLKLPQTTVQALLVNDFTEEALFLLASSKKLFSKTSKSKCCKNIATKLKLVSQNPLFFFCVARENAFLKLQFLSKLHSSKMVFLAIDRNQSAQPSILLCLSRPSSPFKFIWYQIRIRKVFDIRKKSYDVAFCNLLGVIVLLRKNSYKLWN